MYLSVCVDINTETTLSLRSQCRHTERVWYIWSFLFILLIWDRISQCSSDWPRTHRDLPDSALWVLVSHVCASTLGTRGDVFSGAEAVFWTLCNYWSLFFSAKIPHSCLPLALLGSVLRRNFSGPWVLKGSWKCCPLQQIPSLNFFWMKLLIYSSPSPHLLLCC